MLELPRTSREWELQREPKRNKVPAPAQVHNKVPVLVLEQDSKVQVGTDPHMDLGSTSLPCEPPYEQRALPSIEPIDHRHIRSLVQEQHKLVAPVLGRQGPVDMVVVVAQRNHNPVQPSARAIARANRRRNLDQPPPRFRHLRVPFRQSPENWRCLTSIYDSSRILRSALLDRALVVRGSLSSSRGRHCEWTHCYYR